MSGNDWNSYNRYPQGGQQGGYGGGKGGKGQQWNQQQQWGAPQQYQQYPGQQWGSDPQWNQQQQWNQQGYPQQQQQQWQQPQAQPQQQGGRYQPPGQARGGSVPGVLQQPQQQAGMYQAPQAGQQQQQLFQPPAHQQQPAQKPAGKTAVPGKLQPRQVAAPGGATSSGLPAKKEPRQVGDTSGVPGKKEPRKVGGPEVMTGKDGKKNVVLTMNQAPPAATESPAPAKPAAKQSKTISLSAKPTPKPAAEKPAEPEKAPEGQDAKEAKEEKPAAKEPEPAAPEAEPEAAEEDETTKADKPKKEKRVFTKDPRPHLNVVFIGHVDAGKSTISGNMMVLAGCVDDRTMEKYEREAKQKNREGWHLAYIMDLDDAEREKGKTHETGAGYFETPDKRFTILDAPGHKAFVPSMIGGACQADVAVLVISARKGEFETGFDRGGQTREHALLVKTCGVRYLVCVVNKMDDPSAEWSEERFDHIQKSTTEYLKTIGWSNRGEQQFEFLPCSGLTGLGLRQPIPDTVAPWWKGPTLQEALNKILVPGRKDDDPIRMPIHGKYKDEGKLHIHGKLESGKFGVGDKLLMQPMRTVVTIETILVEDHQLDSAHAGDQMILKLKGVDEDDVRQGFVLTDPERPLKNVTWFHAQVKILEVKNVISSGFSCVMHIHSLAEEVVFDELLATIDKKSGKIAEKYPKFVKGKESVMVRMEVPNPCCIEEYKTFDKMGRFMLRSEGKTIAVGVVTKILDKKPERK